MYGNSEQVLGQILPQIDSKMVVSTKLGARPQPFDAKDARALRQSFEESCRLLGRDEIDVLMIHEPDRPRQFDWWDDFSRAEGPVMEVLESLKAEGRIRYLGLGGTTAYEMATLLRTGKFDVVLTAFNYSMLWQEAVHELLPAARDHNVGVVIGSPLQQGALARKWDEVDTGATWLSKPRREQFQALYALLDEIDIPLPELGLRFVLSNPDVHTVLSGVRSAAEVEQNVAAAEKGALPEDLLGRINEIAAMARHRLDRSNRSQETNMKAAIVVEPGSLELRELPVPETEDYQVLCENLFGAVCAGTDGHLIAGNLPIPGISYPLILGHESIGRVVKVGNKVKHFEIGDLITRTGYPGSDDLPAFWGGFSEYGIATDGLAMRDDGVDEEQWSAHMINQVLPEGTNPAAATMMVTWRETYSYISRLGVKPGASVLIIGSGGNGFSFAVMANALGAGTVTMIGNPHWQTTCEKAGIDALLDYRASSLEQDVAAAAGSGFDLVIDAVGRTGALEKMMPFLAPDGRVGIYGIEDLGDRMAYLKVLADAGVTVHGPGEYSEAEAHTKVVELLQAGQLDASIWFDVTAPKLLTEFQSAIDDINAKRSLKAVIKIKDAAG
ncbi:pld1 [Symbiodinium pilosum]|nr:pld1 [Symbiodinium pilosum]